MTEAPLLHDLMQRLENALRQAGDSDLEEGVDARAVERAERLLERHLSPEQQRSLREKGAFEVRGRDGSLWTIRRRGGSVNVSRSDADGKSPYCSDLRAGIPRADTMLVQKLSIEATGGRGLPRMVDGRLVDGEFLPAGRSKPKPGDP